MDVEEVVGADKPLGGLPGYLATTDVPTPVEEKCQMAKTSQACSLILQMVILLTLAP